MILSFILTVLSTLLEDAALIESGGTAVSPAAVVGSTGGKPIYGWASFSTTKPT